MTKYLAIVWNQEGDRDLEPFDRLAVQEIVLALEAREQWADVTGLEPTARLVRAILARLRVCLPTKGAP